MIRVSLLAYQIRRGKNFFPAMFFLSKMNDDQAPILSETVSRSLSLT